MKRIYKYSLEEHINKIEMPKDAEIIHVDTDGYGLYLWAIVNPDAPIETVRITVIGTGWDFELGEVGIYIGTVVMNNGLVWHVFKEVK